MDRNAVLWTLVAFFGATVAFQLIQKATEGESFALTLGLEAIALAAMIVLIVLIVRRRG